MSQKFQPSKRTMITALTGLSDVQASAVSASIDRAGSRPFIICYSHLNQRTAAEALATAMNAHSVQVDAEVLTDQSRAIAWLQTICGDAETIDVAIIVGTQDQVKTLFGHFITPLAKAGQVWAKLPHVGNGDVVTLDLPKRSKDRSGWIYLNGVRKGLVDGEVVSFDKNGNPIVAAHSEHDHSSHSVEHHQIGVSA